MSLYEMSVSFWSNLYGFFKEVYMDFPKWKQSGAIPINLCGVSELFWWRKMKKK
jgi:hypothetical protein